MSYIFTPEIINSLTSYLDQYKSEEILTKIYQWPINSAIDKLSIFDPESTRLFKGYNLFQKTIIARTRVQERLLDNNLSDEIKKKYILWIIRDWGGIKTGNNENIFKHIREKENNESFDCKSIASWSKYFAFKFPQKHAIYDARVIYSLNWLLLKADSERYFPAPDGRNSLMNALDYKMSILVKRKGMSAVKKQIADDIKKREETPGAKSRAITNLKKGLYIKKELSYLSYCHLLTCIASQLFGEKDKHALTKTEMILFAIADKDIVEEVLEHQFPQS